MLSESLIVESRWAITMIVIFPVVFLYRSIASWTIYSFFLSRAEVASSRRRIFGFLIKALAIAILYFWPPDNCPPIDPTCVLTPPEGFNLVLMKSHAFASLSACYISSSVASGLAKSRFSSIEQLNKTGSWGTYPIICLIDVKLRVLMSFPSSKILPPVGS